VTGVELRFEDLCVPRGGRPVLHDVTLAIPSGEITTLLGPNGAGKSTLVLAVGGVVRATSGRVLLGELDLTRRRPEQVREAGVAIVSSSAAGRRSADCSPGASSRWSCSRRRSSRTRR
jgi:branched-chain amino acid transport system ATP-binding protein